MQGGDDVASTTRKELERVSNDEETVISQIGIVSFNVS